MEKKLQVFVSSTYQDLIEERQKAVEGILRAGHIPAGMELFTAASKSQWKVIEEWIKESDLLMLILGGRYGTIEPESGKSYTHLEYEFALVHDIPVFAIVLNDQYLANKKSKDVKLQVYEHEVENPQIEKYKSFKELVTSNLVSFVSDINQISTEVALSLQDFMKKDGKEYHFRGWIRGTDVTQDQLQNLNHKNKLQEIDEELLNKIIEKIEGEHFIHIIKFIATECFYKVEDKRKIDELIYFAQEPSTRFFNTKLEQLFRNLISKLDKFSSFLSTHFFTRNIADVLYLYPDFNIDFTYVDEEGRKLYDKYYTQLSNISRETIEEIREFVYQSRIVLYNSVQNY